MNKTDLIKMVAEKANKPTKEVAEIIDSFFKELSQNLREKDVSIKDFGTFKKIIQPARIARNPATGEPVEVPEKEVVKFKPSKNETIKILLYNIQIKPIIMIKYIVYNSFAYTSNLFISL